MYFFFQYLKHITSDWHHSAQTGSRSSQASATINLTSGMSCTSSSHSALSPSVGHGMLDRNSLQVLSDLCGEKPLEEIKPFHYNISPVSSTHSGQSSHLKKAEEPKSVSPIEIGKLVSSRPHSVAEDSTKSTNLSQNDHNKDIQFTHSHLSQHSYLPNFLMHSEKRQDPAADAACIIADCRENSSKLRTSLGERVEESQIDRQISSASELQIDRHSSLHKSAKPAEYREIQKASCVQPQNNPISQCVIPESEHIHWRQFQSLPDSAGLPHPKLYSNIFCGQNRDFSKQGACCTVDALCEPELSDDLRRDCHLPRNLHHSVFHLEDGDLQDQARDQWMPQNQCFLNDCGHVINSGKDSEEPVNNVLQSEPHGFSLMSNCDEDQNADAVFNNDEEFRVSGLLISPTHPHFQKPSSSSFCIKEEEANVEDSSWSKGATSQFLFGGMNERGSTDFSFRESSHSSYGIFSSTVSRQTPSKMTPSPETINLNIPSNACPTSTSTRSEKGYVKSLFDLLGQKQDGDMFDSGISPLPFSVSKALKKHMNQAEEQSTFRAPSMFRIAQVGHASRGNRISRQAKFTFNHIEMSSQQEPTDCTADRMKVYHSKDYRLREEPTCYFPPLLHESKNLVKNQRNQASVQATNTNSLREDDSVSSIVHRGEHEQFYPACYDMAQPGKPEHFENISSSRNPSYLETNHRRDKSPQLLRSLKYRPVGTRGLEQTVCEPLDQLETVSEDILSSNNTYINGQTQSVMFFDNNQCPGVWRSSPAHISNHSTEHLVRGWNEPGSLSAASQLSNNHQATYSCDEFVIPSANVACDTREILTSSVQRENGRPTSRLGFPANLDSRLPLSGDCSAVAPSIQQRQHSSRWKKYVSADETDKCLLLSNCHNKVQCAPPVNQYSKQYSGKVSAVSVAGLTYNRQDSSPPMDFSGSDVIYFSLKGSRTALEDSKLKKWREYFLSQTFAKKGEIPCRHEQATHETSADNLHCDQSPKRKEPQI
ncbi:hypothetical protein PoB_001730200 [Plakobranchus ocellatus]|uniref:PH domain-containing protein n=1 Tax=Plakobranchus ocellatus TaxID=259542 RepID=A0AAV3Z698_9GAST|nr:hypothetical protein PoB_001730200 [Plakobranchus ocellatus]